MPRTLSFDNHFDVNKRQDPGTRGKARALGNINDSDITWIETETCPWMLARALTLGLLS